MINEYTIYGANANRMKPYSIDPMEIYEHHNRKLGTLHTIWYDRRTWFLGLEIATCLQYRNPPKALTEKVPLAYKIKSDGKTIPSLHDRKGKTRHVTWITILGVNVLRNYSDADTNNHDLDEFLMSCVLKTQHIGLGQDEERLAAANPELLEQLNEPYEMFDMEDEETSSSSSAADNAMSTLRIFEHEQFGKIRVLAIDGEPWAVGKDVATALGYSNTKDALAKHVDEEDKRIVKGRDLRPLENYIPKSALPVDFIPADIPNRGLTAINESGIYALIFGSKLPSAKQFKHWVTSEVLPTIRKTGRYTMPGAVRATEAMTHSDAMTLHEDFRDLIATMRGSDLGTTQETARNVPHTQGYVSQLIAPAWLYTSGKYAPQDEEWVRQQMPHVHAAAQRFCLSDRQILARIYQEMQIRYTIRLADYKDSYRKANHLSDCSMLDVISLYPHLRDMFTTVLHDFSPVIRLLD